MKTRYAQDGFTLIELLVVVSIVAMLVAILLPSLSQVRAQAKSAVCSSNLHQVGVGMTMYQNQYGVYPAHRTPLPQDYRWFTTMAKMLGQNKEVQNCAATPDWDRQIGRNTSYGYNYKYLGSARTNPISPTAPYENWPVRSIPAPIRTIAFGDNDGTGWKEPYRSGSTDWWRFGNHGYTLDPTYLPIHSLASVSNDGQPEAYSWKTYRTYPSTRHWGGGNFCFVDGHVERKRPEQLLQDNRYWNGLGAEDPERDPHVPYKYDSSTEWRFAGTIAAAGR